MSEINLSDKRRQNARRRWQWLIEVVTQQRSEISQEESITRRFSTFGLLKTDYVYNDELHPEHRWYNYTCPYFPDFSMIIRHLDASFDIDTILGFNNTGNVCVWPAEEILTYYILKNKDLAKGKRICEIGGGMTCLSGIASAIYTGAESVLLTDGNEKSVENVQEIIKTNEKAFGECVVSSKVLKWDNLHDYDMLLNSFDLILCADCLFFEEVQLDLCNALFDMVKSDGIILIFAPNRGNTFQNFLNLAKKKFQVEYHENYDDAVDRLHLENLKKGLDSYDPDIHYPIMLKLKKI